MRLILRRGSGHIELFWPFWRPALEERSFRLSHSFLGWYCGSRPGLIYTAEHLLPEVRPNTQGRTIIGWWHYDFLSWGYFTRPLLDGKREERAEVGGAR